MTPDQIKAIAKSIRAAEKRTLTTQMSNTTTLNAIVQGLGLGETFSGYLASLEKKPATQTNPQLYIVWENPHTDEELCEPYVKDALIAFSKEKGFDAFLTEGIHGFSTLMLWSTRTDMTQDSLNAVRDELLAFVQTYVEQDELETPKGTLAWLESPEAEKIIANFMYHDNGQVCSASLSEAAWKNRASLNMEDDEAFMLLYGDVEIESYYTANDISLQDLMTNVEFYQE